MSCIIQGTVIYMLAGHACGAYSLKAATSSFLTFTLLSAYTLPFSSEKIPVSYAELGPLGQVLR